jgi:hypothetical protein
VQGILICLYLQQNGEIKIHMVIDKGKVEAVVFCYEVNAGQRQRRDRFVCHGQ